MENPYSDAMMPLPRHTRLDCSECYAKAVLEELFAEDLGELELSDAPDLRSRQRSVGIEVTSARSSEDHCAQALYTEWSAVAHHESGAAAEERKRRIEREIERKGAELSGGILFGPNGTDSFGSIYEAVEKKQAKLSSGMYAKLEDHRLYVESDILASESMLSAALSKIDSLCRDAEPPSFSTVYVAVPGYLYLFDVTGGERATMPISDGLQYELAMWARKTVIDEEARAKNEWLGQ